MYDVPTEKSFSLTKSISKTLFKKKRRRSSTFWMTRTCMTITEDSGETVALDLLGIILWNSILSDTQ